LFVDRATSNYWHVVSNLVITAKLSSNVYRLVICIQGGGLSNMYTTIYLKYVVAMAYSSILTNRVRTSVELGNRLCKHCRCYT